MSNDLTVRPEGRAPTAFGGAGVQLQTYDDAVRFATAVYQSGLAPKGFQNPQAVLVAMQAGMELGLSPMRAVQSVAVVNGRPTLWGDALLAVAQASGLVSDVSERIDGDGDERRAVCIVTRKDGRTIERTFSVADARTAGLWAKAGPWQQYPARMLQMRARSFAIRDAVPEALCGFVTREEADDHVGPDRAKDVTPQRAAPAEADPLLESLTLPAPAAPTEETPETIDKDTGEVIDAPAMPSIPQPPKRVSEIAGWANAAGRVLNGLRDDMPAFEALWAEHRDTVLKLEQYAGTVTRNDASITAIGALSSLREFCDGMIEDARKPSPMIGG